MGTALRGQRDTTRGPGGKRIGSQFPAASGLRQGSLTSTHPPRPGFQPPYSLHGARAWGPHRAPVSSWLLTSGWEATGPQGAESSGIRRAGPGGPPLAGRGARRRGGCHASRALGNLGLQATPSGGGGSSRARPPARGGVRRRSPPLPSRRHGPPRTDSSPRPPPPRTATPRYATRPWRPQLPSPPASLSSPETRVSKELKWAHTVKCWRPKVSALLFPHLPPHPTFASRPTLPLTQVPPLRAPVCCAS